MVIFGRSGDFAAFVLPSIVSCIVAIFVGGVALFVLVVIASLGLWSTAPPTWWREIVVLVTVSKGFRVAADRLDARANRCNGLDFGSFWLVHGDLAQWVGLGVGMQPPSVQLVV